jgi:hypothetical protein
MPEGRLQRTRAAYDRRPTLEELLVALPPLPTRPCQVFTDPSTGHTTRLYETERFVPWNVIEGEPLESQGQ